MNENFLSDQTLRFIGESSKNNRYLTLPSYLSTLAFASLVYIKLQIYEYKSISWTFVFFPLLVSDFLMGYAKLYYLMKDYFSRSQYIVRSMYRTLDIIGSLLAKIGICLYLNHYEQIGSNPLRQNARTITGNYSSLVYSLIPLWVSVFFSLILRALCGGFLSEPIQFFFTDSSNRFRMFQNASATISHLSLFALLRGIQPLIIALQLDGVICENWSVVFSPFWMLTFSGIAVALIIIICAPYIHQRSPAALRESSYTLVFIFAVKIILFCTCSMICVIYLVQRLDFEFQFTSGKNISVLQIIIPIVTLYALLIVMHPVLSRAIERYDDMYAMLAHFNVNNVSGMVPNILNRRVHMAKLHSIIWLQQQSNSVYIKIEAEEAMRLCPESELPYCINILSNYSCTSLTTIEESIYLLNICTTERLKSREDRNFLHLEGLEMGERESSSFHSYQNNNININVDVDDLENRIGNNLVDIISRDSREDSLLGDVEMRLITSSNSSSLMDECRQDNVVTNPMYNDTNIVDLSVITQQHLKTNDSARESSNQERLDESSPRELEPSSPSLPFLDNCCVVCYGEDTGTVLMHCGHSVMCWTCARRVCKTSDTGAGASAGAGGRCPICRVSIDQLLKITRKHICLTDGRIVTLCDEGYRLLRPNNAS